MARNKKISDDEILDLAFPVICRVGFDSFTLEQVSQVTGLSPATLLQRFGSKRELAFRVRDRKWDRNLSQFEAAETGPQGLAGIDQLLAEIGRSVDSQRLNEHLRLLADDMGDSRLRVGAAHFFSWTRGLIQRFLTEAVAAGELCPDTPVAELSCTLEALIQGSIFQFGFLDEPDIGPWIRRHIDFLLGPYRIR